MSTVESSKKINLLLIILAFVVSSVTLWLLESPLKPMLYFFEAALILTIYHSLYGNFKKTSFKIRGDLSNIMLNVVCAIVLGKKHDS